MTFIRTFGVVALSAIPTFGLAQEPGLIPTNGITCNVQTWGDPARPALVLMHGCPCSVGWVLPAPGASSLRFWLSTAS